jgi:hypothetical protein
VVRPTTSPSRFDAAVAHLAAMAAGPIGEPGARMSVIVADARPQLIAARLAEPEGLAPSLMRLRAGDGDADWAQVINLVSSVIKDGEATRLVLIARKRNCRPRKRPLSKLVIRAPDQVGLASPVKALYLESQLIPLAKARRVNPWYLATGRVGLPAE